MNGNLKGLLIYLLWTLVATLWIALIAIMPDFLDNPAADIRTIATITAYIVACSVPSFLFIYLFGLNKWCAAVFLPLYGILGAAVSYYRVVYRVTVTPLMIECIFNTGVDTVKGVISWQLLVWILLNILIAIGLVIYRWRTIYIPNKNIWWQALCAILLFAGYYSFNGRLHRSLNQRFPLLIVNSLVQYQAMQAKRSAVRVTPTYTSIADQRTDSLQIIVVLGESVRPDHLSLNGYNRPTTPRLSQRKNIISYPNIYSQYTHTAASIPAILTRADSLQPDLAYQECGFTSILTQEGFYSAWISNQNMSDAFAAFPNECDTAIWVNAGKSAYVFSGWYDEEILPHLHEQITLANPKNLFILHTIGSHWYYDNHVPESSYYFKPLTNNREITNNTTEQIINSYDNTIRYMDYVVDSIISCFDDKNAIVFYLSDHGEALGEDGRYLHAGDAPPMYRCACFIWYSDQYAEAFPDKVDALYEHQNQYYLTDFFFHTILSVAQVNCETEYIPPYPLSNTKE